MDTGENFTIMVDGKVVITDYDGAFDGQSGVVLGFFPRLDDDEEEFELEDYGAIVLLDEAPEAGGDKAVLIPVVCLVPFTPN